MFAEEAKEEKGTLGFFVPSLEDDEMLLCGPLGPRRPAADTLTYAHTAKSNKPDSTARE